MAHRSRLFVKLLCLLRVVFFPNSFFGHNSQVDQSFGIYFRCPFIQILGVLYVLGHIVPRVVEIPQLCDGWRVLESSCCLNVIETALFVDFHADSLLRKQPHIKEGLSFAAIFRQHLSGEGHHCKQCLIIIDFTAEAWLDILELALGVVNFGALQVKISGLVHVLDNADPILIPLS